MKEKIAKLNEMMYYNMIEIMEYVEDTPDIDTITEMILLTYEAFFNEDSEGLATDAYEWAEKVLEELES